MVWFFYLLLLLVVFIFFPCQSKSGYVVRSGRFSSD
uniref:p4 n=1 Tax=Blackberry yellow vein-associated virus TaxID=404196 RepID=Q5FYX9_9CLOS|nr:p4 [Blackberry yellow vein-associated virus]AFK94550.1 P4 [Blackberry yellow vein-associated virus]AFK94552.1 P4 [Blackberry yellow vein-associated virus]AFK94554.1 P4 [Blackberry yellow vein-associated virus]AFK94556.1 P4 [Blackberry yellow vein-associated virus]